MRSHIFLATPCYGGVVTQGYMQSVCGLMAASGSMQIDITLALLGQDALITRCRNTLVGHFLAQPAATHLLFVDADISFSPDNVARLLASARPIAAGLYPLKAYYWDRAFAERRDAGEPIETAGLHYVGRLRHPDRLHRDGDFATADFAGTGFMLIERATLERMIEAYPETRYSKVDAYRSHADTGRAQHALFDCVIDPDTGTYLSEDYTFCRRWQRIGGEVWLDTAASLTHSGPADFTGVPAVRFG
jgi:hypothetical protein